VESYGWITVACQLLFISVQYVRDARTDPEGFVNELIELDEESLDGIG